MSLGKNRGVGVRYSLPSHRRLEGAGIMYSLFLVGLSLAKLQSGSKLGKEYVKAVYCHPAYLSYMQNAGLDKASWNQDCWETY